MAFTSHNHFDCRPTHGTARKRHMQDSDGFFSNYKNTLLSTGSTQEDRILSRHEWKSVDWDVKHHTKRTITQNAYSNSTINNSKIIFRDSPYYKMYTPKRVPWQIVKTKMKCHAKLFSCFNPVYTSDFGKQCIPRCKGSEPSTLFAIMTKTIVGESNAFLC